MSQFSQLLLNAENEYERKDWDEAIDWLEEAIELINVEAEKKPKRGD